MTIQASEIAERVVILELGHQLFINKMKPLFKFKTTDENVVSMALLYDVVYCDLNLGRKMPTGFTE